MSWLDTVGVKLGSVTVEDWFGIVGSLLLLWAPGRDQWLRFRALIFKREGELAPSSIKKYWRVINERHEHARNAWNFGDTLTTALGAICIGASYVFKYI
jgi:hypothetical protein